MFKTIGFSPMIRGLVKEMGGKTNRAYVYGYMWLEQNSDSHFYEPKDNLPERLGVSKSTVLRTIKWLCENGYLIDLTPERENEPHKYQITDKVSLKISVQFSIFPTKMTRQPFQNDTALPYQNDTAHGGVILPPHVIYHHDHDDQIGTAIEERWAYFDMDFRALPKMLNKWREDPEKLLWLLDKYIDADQAGLLNKWTQAKLYRRLEAGEMPPEKPRTIGDEVRELMELQNGGEIE